MNQISVNWTRSEQGGDAERHPQRAPEAGQQAGPHRAEAGVEQGDGEAEAAAEAEAGASAASEASLIALRGFFVGDLRFAGTVSAAAGEPPSNSSPNSFAPCPSVRTGSLRRRLGRDPGLGVAGDELRRRRRWWRPR